MKYYADNSIPKALVDLEVANRKYVLTLYDRIIEVIKKFDGKILNKRLETALKAIDSNLGIEIRTSSSIYIYYYCNNHCVKMNGGVYYITHREITLNSYASTYITTHFKNENECVVTLDENFNKRLDANALIEKLMQQRKNIEDYITEIEIKHGKIAEYEAILKALKKQIEDTCKEIPYMLQEYYNLNYNVQQM